MPKKAVVLLSGGIDSATSFAVARGKNYLVHALTFDYGQRHSAEIAAARRVAASMNAAQHLVVRFDLRGIGGSALTSDIPVPKNRDEKAIRSGIPVTYVPARNTIFLSVALGWAESLGARDIFIGVNALDYSGYPDCRSEFIRQFESLAAVATKAGVEGAIFRIHAPLIEFTKAEIIRRGTDLGVDFSLTHSCYDPLRGRGPSPDGQACGACDSCIIRRKGFEEAGLKDPCAPRP